MDHNKIATLLRDEAPGVWLTIHEDTTLRARSRVNNWRTGSARGQRPKAFTPAYEFKLESCGYGTGRTKIKARYNPDLDPAPRKKKAKKKGSPA